tara:strand:+ start:2941 stop:4101 length:1161 start_codon:yes stop_codon:yes gene_type:complete
METKYLLNFIKNTAIILVFLSPIPLFLFSTGEFQSIALVADKQLSGKSNSIYGVAFRNNTIEYKMQMLSEVNPKIITLGSSRVLQFSKEMFNKDFYNLGNTMSSINEGFEISDHIINQNPEIVFFGIDFWWFNENWLTPRPLVIKETLLNNIDEPYSIDISNIMETIKWIFSGKIALLDIYNQIFHGNNNIGLQGIYADGFRSDGQHFSSRTITGEFPTKDINFIATTKEVNMGTRYNFSKGINSKHYNNFLVLVEKLRLSGIKVVIFLPPFAPEINTVLNNSKKIKFIEELKNEFIKNNLPFYDFTDSEKINSSSCEFIDGIHPGIVTNARILLKISKNDAKVQKHLNYEYIKNIVDNNQGLSYLPNNEISSLPEVDYLNIGCKK